MLFHSRSLFFLLVSLRAASAGFIVVLPRKPGKVSAAAVIGRVESASWLQRSAGPSASLPRTSRHLNVWEAQKKKRSAAAAGAGFTRRVVPAVICLVLTVTNCAMWKQPAVTWLQ